MQRLSTNGEALQYVIPIEEWQLTIVTALGDTVIGSGAQILVNSIRAGGLAALVGAVGIKQGATVIGQLPALAALGTERRYDGVKITNLTINLASAGDKVLVFWKPIP